MIDLATYHPQGDKKNSDFFNEYPAPGLRAPRRGRARPDRRATMAGVVIQVEHGDGINYLAELAVMGPYRLVEARLSETHRVYLLRSQPEFPRLIVLEPLAPTLRGRDHALERAVPAVAAQAERPLRR